LVEPDEDPAPLAGTVVDRPPPDYRHCAVCGKEFPVNPGRGRKPSKCEEHRTTRSAKNDSTPRSVKAGSDVDTAVSTMTSMNTLLSMLSMGLRLNATAEMLSNDEQFIVEMRRAFMTNPKLAARVAKLGSVSGTAAFVAAMTSFYAPIVMTAVIEAPSSPILSRLPIFNTDDE
jgi:hypothetical protein